MHILEQFQRILCPIQVNGLETARRCIQIVAHIVGELLICLRRKAQILLDAVRMYENKYKAAGSIYAVEYDVYDVHIVAGQLHDEDELG